MSKKNKVKMAKVFISSFAFGGSIPIQTATSIFATAANLRDNGVGTSLDLRVGGPYVQKERNISIQRFLETDCTHLLFIDADLVFDPTACLKMMLKKKPVIGGLYRYKMEKEAYPCQLFVQDKGDHKGELVEQDGCFLASGLPTGFLLIQRGVLEQMIATFPETRYEVRESDNGPAIMTLHNIFDCVLYNGQWWGEDYIFCKRWTAMGGELWAYADFDCAHVGTYGYVGNYSKFYHGNIDAQIERNLREIEEQDARH